MSASSSYGAHVRWKSPLVLALAAFTTMVAGAVAQTPEPTEVRRTLPLMENWRFVQDDDLSEEDALEGDGEGWETVELPHTWNAEDAASLQAEGYVRGLGWYQLEFDTPEEGERHWLEFGAASLVADVWLNGERLGQHKGGFTAFRFDVTEGLVEDGTNRLLVKVDNSVPEDDDAVTAIPPMRGDFNVSGGLYRHVALISTPAPVHFSLDDMGGSGVYATTTAVAGGNATVEVRVLLASAGDPAAQQYVEPAGDNYLVRFSLLDANGNTATQGEERVTLAPGTENEVTRTLEVENARLWQGVADPYLYQLVAELVSSDETVIDRVAQHFGIREIRFDPEEGFSLNGQHIGRLNGVGMHQDLLGKGWAISNEDIDHSLAMIREMGANTVRYAHYPYSSYAYDRASELGLVVWAEAAFGIYTRVKRCSKDDPTDEFVSSAKQQLRELIRQNYNHASIAMWAIGNESTQGQLNCNDPYDNVRPLLREMHETARDEDASRLTVYSEYPHPVDRSGPFATEGTTDLFATNRYFLWYTPEFEDFSPVLDGTIARTPDQPLSVSEYGGGAALTHHTDNPLGGYPEVRSAPAGQVAYQPEEFAAYIHEQNYRVIASKPYLWGSFVWNMFDFGSDHRNEGDVLGVNTKGLVAFDHETRKDPFYFYKANWSDEPVTYIAGRRYTDRAYPVADVKVYSNADTVELSVNGVSAGRLDAAQCEQRTCVFKDVKLDSGDNTVMAVGLHGGERVSDSVKWALTSRDINIAAGRLATGLVSSSGVRFGSDHYFSGGRYGPTVREASALDVFSQDGKVPTEVLDDVLLFRYYRLGDFRYEIPLDAGRYQVMLGFLEPNANNQPGDRVFDVIANGQTLLNDFDILDEAINVRLPVVKTFTVYVAGEGLTLGFDPIIGEAIVSNIRIRSLDPLQRGADGGEDTSDQVSSDPSEPYVGSQVPRPASAGPPAFDIGPSPDDVLDAVVRVGDWALQNPASHDPASWIMAPLYDGLIDASLATGDPRYLSAVLRAGQCAGFETGSRTYHADGHAAGRVWLRLYQMSEPKFPALLEPWVELFDEVVQNPITQEWLFEEAAPYGLRVTDRWVWSDALYMSPPTIAVLFEATGDERYLQFMDTEFQFAYDALFDPQANLFYRDSRFIGQRTPNGEKVFWGRGNGWVLAGLALVLESIPSDYPTRPFYEDLFQKMSRAIADAQQPDGFWNPSLHDAAHVPFPETSGTALFVRALASGVRQGLLDPETYWPVAQRGWNALQSAIRPDGAVMLVQPPAPEPRLFNPTSIVPYGTGAVLGAGAEILRVLGADSGKNPALLLRSAEASVDQAPLLWTLGKAACRQR